MISSRCADTFDGQTLSTHRRGLQNDLESERLFGEQVFEVSINETAGVAAGSSIWWEWCIGQAREADLVIVLYDGHSGGTLMQQGGVGICSAEFIAAMAAAPQKVGVIDLEPLQPLTSRADARFKANLELARQFRTGAQRWGTTQHGAPNGLGWLARSGAPRQSRG